MPARHELMQCTFGLTFGCQGLPDAPCAMGAAKSSSSRTRLSLLLGFSATAMEKVPAYLARIYHETWAQRRVLRKSKVAAVAAFTVDGDDDDILLFAGQRTDSRDSVFVFMIGSYKDLNIVTRSVIFSSLIGHCDHCCYTKALDRNEWSPFLETVLDRVESVRQQILLLKEPVQGKIQTPFAKLEDWMQLQQRSEDLVNELMDPSPGPFSDAEQHPIVALKGEDSVESVQAALQKSSGYATKSAIRLHIYVNWDCCDYCSFMLLSCYNCLKALYAGDGQEFHIHIYGHARYANNGSQGVQYMIDKFPEELSKYVHFTAL